MRTTLVIAATVAALAVTATATYGLTRDDPSKLTVGLGEPATLLPGLVDDPAGRLVLSALWTPLTEVEASGRPVPRLAASVTSADQRVWTIRLRPGWRFHDGTPVTARAVAGTWQATLAQGWRGAGLLTDTLRVRGGRPGHADIPGLRVTGEDTVEVTLEAPFAELPLALSAPELQPLPESVLSTRDWAGFAARPVGTGPYRLDGAWRPGHGATLRRFAGYAGPRPTADRIDLRVLDPATQYAQVSSGDLDLATDLPPDRHAAFGTAFGARHGAWPLGAVTYLGFARTDRRFADPGVRHAVSLAIDRAGLAAGPLGHQVSPSTALVPPGIPGARSGACRACQHDETAARATLAGLGGAPAGAVRLWYQPSQAGWVAALADQLGRALHLSVLPSPLTGGTPADGMFLVDQTVMYPSAYPALLPLVGRELPEVRRLATAAASRSDPTERLRGYRLAENVALRDLPLVPLWSRHGHAVWSSRVTALPTDLYGPRLDQLR
ncbi:oligopeptide transport system substrate-binding protein [Krasilnikovia cinnamomea]|uniref:Oligopeptide transport system substrate-binding protein n=1 Tax=Krasilnikovia cinnamomea TaxID=349313 RepID=A0A4Q7ZMW5_9ACTN|nr:ABC transporter substrate-binding protein [Krasilnikovia cinnamomea]RZU52357.1 oligopeptide transport system substrate-binding protein [Krasilnikovia cinnamomea]